MLLDHHQLSFVLEALLQTIADFLGVLGIITVDLSNDQAGRFFTHLRLAAFDRLDEDPMLLRVSVVVDLSTLALRMERRLARPQ